MADTNLTSVELKEVDCCARCDHFGMDIETLSRFSNFCTLHTVSKYSSMTKRKHAEPTDVEPYNICKDFTDEE